MRGAAARCAGREQHGGRPPARAGAPCWLPGTPHALRACHRAAAGRCQASWCPCCSRPWRLDASRPPAHPLLLLLLLLRLLPLSCSYTRLSSKLEEIFGMSYFLPTHQGRACEHILVRAPSQPCQPALLRRQLRPAAHASAPQRAAPRARGMPRRCAAAGQGLHGPPLPTALPLSMPLPLGPSPSPAGQDAGYGGQLRGHELPLHGGWGPLPSCIAAFFCSAGSGFGRRLQWVASAAGRCVPALWCRACAREGAAARLPLHHAHAWGGVGWGGFPTPPLALLPLYPILSSHRPPRRTSLCWAAWWRSWWQMRAWWCPATTPSRHEGGGWEGLL